MQARRLLFTAAALGAFALGAGAASAKPKVVQGPGYLPTCFAP